MNKRVITSYVQEPNILQPLVISELDWIQSNISGLTSMLGQALSPPGLGRTPMVIDGQSLSDIKTFISGTTYSYAPFWTLVETPNPYLFYFSGNSAFDASGGEYFHVGEIFPNPSDPVIFSNGNPYYVMEQEQLTLSNVSSGAYFGFSDLFTLRGEWNYVGAAGQPAFQNSWSGDGYVSFKFNSMSQQIELRGECLTSLTASCNNVIFTLPVGYRPSLRKTVPIFNINNSNETQIISLQILSSGDVTAYYLTGQVPQSTGSYASIIATIDGVNFTL